jgi:hypothetical protein
LIIAGSWESGCVDGIGKFQLVNIQSGDGARQQAHKEPLTKPQFEALGADQRAAQGHERVKDVGTLPIADAQAAILEQPTDGALDHPAVLAKAAAGRLAALGDEMMLAAFLAAVGRVGTRLGPPNAVRTEVLSTTARDRSSLSAPRRRASSTGCTRSYTPATCRSCRWCQHVIPQPRLIHFPRDLYQFGRVPGPTQRFGSGVRIAFGTYSQKEKPWEIV